MLSNAASINYTPILAICQNNMRMKKAVFLDRDGVINDGTLYYTYKKADFRLNDGVPEALAILRKAGFTLIGITNQGGISKGQYEKKNVDLVHKYMQELLAENGTQLDDIFYCPHHSNLENCLCRKPKSLLIEKAMAKYEINPKNSFLIGDSQRDIEAGEKAGLQSFKIEKNENILSICQKIACL